MGRARLRASDEVDDLGEHKHGPYQLGRMLRGVHDELGLWQRCRHKACIRARRCRGGADQCPENMDVTVIWLREARRAGCAGASPRAAVRIADRHVLAMLGGAQPRPAAKSK